MAGGIGRRLIELERRLPVPRSRAPCARLPWLGRVPNDDLVWMENVLGHGEMTESDRLRFIEIEAAATRRMLAGWPSWAVARERYDRGRL
jgi:hypothetical protein